MMSELTILTVALHHRPEGYIGGGWVRLIEFLKRAKQHGLNYVIIETRPTFKEIYHINYDVVEVPPITSVASIPHVLGETIRAGVNIAKKKSIDLILSPVEVEYCVFAAYLLSMILRKPWTVNIQLVPVFGLLLQRRSLVPSLRNLYSYCLERSKSWSRSVVKALANKVVYMILRETLLITPGKSVAEDIRMIDSQLNVLDCWPGNGIDANRIDQIPESIRTYTGIYVGPILKEKGAFDAIRIWKHVTNKMRNATLVIIGKGEKQMVDILYKLIRNLGLERNVLVPFDLSKGAPLREDVWSFMKQSMIFVYPSLLDCWPLVVGEALACGLPVVAYDIRPIRYGYGNCSAVFLVEPQNISAFATKIVSILNTYDECNYTMLARAFSKKLDWNDAIRVERDAYLRILKKWHSVCGAIK